MKSSGLQALSSPFLEEAGEPRPKKIKIDRSIVNLEKEQQQWLQKLHDATKKSSSKILCFSEVLCHANQKGLELQNESTTNYKASIRTYSHFQLHININLQSSLLRNIQFNENHSIENRDFSVIGAICSELNEHNILVTNTESWTLYAKEREKSVETGRSWNELTTVGPIFSGIWAENFITRIKPLLMSATVFQSNDANFCHVHDISRSRALYQVLKPVAVCDSSSVKILSFTLQARSFMNGSKSDLGSLFYKNKNVNKVGNILSYLKQTTCLANNNFRINKGFQHLYKRYSRKCERVMKSKLVKCAAFELLLQDERECNCSTVSEKNDTSIFSQRSAFNIHLKKSSKGSSSKECHVFYKATVESVNTFLIDGNEKEKKTRQHVLHDNQIPQDNNIHSFTVWDANLITAKKEEDMAAHSRYLNTLSSVPNLFKLSIKHSSLKMIVAMETCTQKKKIKTFNRTSVFLRKCKNFNFFLGANKKHKAKKFRNSINFLKERKYVPGYLGTFSRAVMGIRKCSNCEDVKKNHHTSVAARPHLSLYETYKKIPLSDDSEELDQISFVSKAVFNYKNNEIYSKGYTTTASRITYNGHNALTYFLPKLLFSAITNDNYLLVQQSRSTNCSYPNHISTNSQQKNCNMPFPFTGSNSGNILFLASAILPSLSVAQNTTVSAKAWHCKVALFGKTRKQNSCIFDKMKNILQDMPVCRPQVCKSSKHFKTVENITVLLQKVILLLSTHSSELVMSVKQIAEYVKETENTTIEKIYTIKSNQHQNLILPYFKNESSKAIDSTDRLMKFSCAMKREHFENVTEKHLSSEFKNKCEFEMKNQFDLVLKELNVFNDISREDKNSLLCEQRNLIEEDSFEFNCLDSILHEDSKNIFENKENVTFSTCGTINYTTMVNENKNEQIIFKDIRLKHSGEQEVPLGDCSSRIVDEELFYPTPEEYFDSGCKQPFPWNPAFVSHTSMKERSYSLQGARGNCFNDGIIRVQPLKTCHGPLRVGLSRKAKPKQLHPYLK